jgi:hypothetical protein
VQSLTLRTPTLDDVFLHVTGAHLEPGRDQQGYESDDDVQQSADEQEVRS